MSWKDNFILEHGEEAYVKRLTQKRAHYKAHKEEEKARVRKYQAEHPEQVKAHKKKYREAHPEQVIVDNQEICRKGGSYYDKHLAYMQTGLPGERHKIRKKHGHQYKPYKDIIAPDSQIHHSWRPNSAEYDGVALVEADQHMRGFIDVIQILEGEITIFSEEELRNRGVI